MSHQLSLLKLLKEQFFVQEQLSHCHCLGDFLGCAEHLVLTHPQAISLS
jgi:hypothetical protein